jgi:hypothetical protein
MSADTVRAYWETHFRPDKIVVTGAGLGHEVLKEGASAICFAV